MGIEREKGYGLNSDKGKGHSGGCREGAADDAGGNANSRSGPGEDRENLTEAAEGWESREVSADSDPISDGTDCFEELRKIKEEYGLLEEQLRLKESQMEEVISRFQRLQADFENFRKRTQKEKEEMRDTAAAALVEALLPVFDNFDRAVNAPASDDLSFREGVKMIFKQFQQVLEEAGLEPIECVGTIFDPNYQQAVFRGEDDSLEENTVIEELQKGFIFGGKVLRPAMVKVSCKSVQAE